MLLHAQPHSKPRTRDLANQRAAVLSPKSLPTPSEIPNTGPLFMHSMRGTGARLVVSLAGVGRGGKPPPLEFVKTASNGGTNHVLFVADPNRSWMNGPGVAETLISHISRYTEAHGISEIVALGNSMGGFSALRLADLMDIRTVIAFAPQFSANPALVPEETRWKVFRRQIEAFPHPHVGALAQSRTVYFIFHGDAPMEAIHWSRFPSHKRLNHFIFAGEGHNIARLLKRRRLLNRVVRKAMRHKAREVRVLLEAEFAQSPVSVWRREAYPAPLRDPANL